MQNVQLSLTTDGYLLMVLRDAAERVLKEHSSSCCAICTIAAEAITRQLASEVKARLWT